MSMKIDRIFYVIGVLIACISCSDRSKTIVPRSETRQENVSSEQRDSIVQASELGIMEEHLYEGLLPSASGPGTEYRLLIRNRQYSGDGTFRLTLNCKGADNIKDKSVTYTGKRFTQRGIPGDDNATVWQCITDDGTRIFNFLRLNENTLMLLNDKFEKPDTQSNYNLIQMDSILSPEMVR